MTKYRTLLSGLCGLFLPASLAVAEPAAFAVGDAMPTPAKEHFVVTFSIKCNETDSARVDRYEHGGETAVVAYVNDSKMPYGYFLVHLSTLLLDNDPQDGRIDSISVLSPEEDVRICNALPNKK